MNENEILFFRLKNNEDVIGEVVEVNAEDGYVALRNPQRVLYIPGEMKGTIRITLFDWILPEISLDEEILVHLSDVMTFTKVRPEIATYYKKNADLTKKSRETPLMMQTTEELINKLMENTTEDDNSDNQEDDDIAYVKDALADIQKRYKGKLN